MDMIFYKGLKIVDEGVDIFIYLVFLFEGIKSFVGDFVVDCKVYKFNEYKMWIIYVCNINSVFEFMFIC